MNIANNFEEEIDNYFPVEPNKYQFLGLTNLITGLDKTIDEGIRQINVCAYRVINEKKSPFIEYLLQKNTGFYSNLNFPHLPITDPTTSIKVDELVTNFNSLLSSLLIIGHLNFDGENHNFINSYKGFYMFENKIYLFFDLTDMDLKMDPTYRNERYFFCLIDEILNSKKMCDINISEDVTNFFIKTTCINKYAFCVLQDENSDQYESPYVAFVGTNTKSLNFTYIFGVSKQDSNSILGQYYYFTDYNNALQKGGVVRFAIFLGKLQKKMNFVSDDIDESQIKKERLLDNKLDTNYEKLTMRISDHDSKWTDTYDSVILEDIELDDGTKLKNTPMYVCKNYEQQYPLSFHYVNNVYEKYNNNVHFSVM